MPYCMRFTRLNLNLCLRVDWCQGKVSMFPFVFTTPSLALLFVRVPLALSLGLTAALTDVMAWVLVSIWNCEALPVSSKRSAPHMVQTLSRARALDLVINPQFWRGTPTSRRIWVLCVGAMKWAHRLVLVPQACLWREECKIRQRERICQCSCRLMVLIGLMDCCWSHASSRELPCTGQTTPIDLSGSLWTGGQVPCQRSLSLCVCPGFLALTTSSCVRFATCCIMFRRSKGTRWETSTIHLGIIFHRAMI